MSHTNKTIRLSAKLILLSFGLTLAACGGGGGGGSTYPSIQYTGNTSQATVTADNADEFPVTMLEGSTSSAEANPYGAAIDSNTTPDAQHTTMLNMLAEQVKSTIINRNNSSNSSIVSAVTETIPGNCPGHPGSMTVTDNSTQTSLNASVTYDNFCVGNFSTDNLEMTIHGKMNFGGSLISVDPLIIKSLSMSVEYMKMTVRNLNGTYSEEFSGSMTITFDETIDNNITNMTVSTNFQANGLTYKIENLVVDTISGLNISGRFYHPVHGYVDVITTENFDLYSINPDKYCTGSLQITGSGGVIDFTANTGCVTYDICFTPDGGGQTCTTNVPWPQ